MSDDTDASAQADGDGGDAAPAAGENLGERMSFTFRYQGPSDVQAAGAGAQLSLVGNELRDQIRAQGRLKDPLRFREALSVLYAVVGSDYRYTPKDRTAYLAYMRQQQAAPKQTMWDAQKAYFDWLKSNDPTAFIILDPVVSVQPDGLFFEVFSKDESTYAQLAVSWDAVELEGELGYGTTNIDFSKSLFDGVQRIRGYRETRLSIGRDAVKLETGGHSVMEKQIAVPDSWLRAFLQVQSAATLSGKTSFSLTPIDLYNVLRFLRFHADEKKKGRGLRIELIPGEAPRLILEPWEEVFHSSAGIYKGKTSEVIKIWGRRRLSLVSRLLPFLESIDIHLFGSGLPSFSVFRAGPFKLTLGLTGWTTADWSQGACFDLLLPRSLDAEQDLQKVLGFLAKKRGGSSTEIGKGAKVAPEKLLAALQLGCQKGLLMYDIDGDVYRLRALSAEPLAWDRLEYRNDRERVAHDLLVKGAVLCETENRIAGTGVELTGKVTVKADERDYRPVMTIDPTGRVRKAECSCHFYRTNKMTQGPCAHILGLRLWYAEEEARRRELAKKGERRDTTTVETRTYAKRHDKGGEELAQLTIDHKRLKTRWGERGKLRVQNLVFNTVEEARAAYFTKLDGLALRGFFDATEGGA